MEIIPSKLYISEATESKNKTDEELKVPDPKNVTLSELLEQNASTSEHVRK